MVCSKLQFGQLRRNANYLSEWIIFGIFISKAVQKLWLQSQLFPTNKTFCIPPWNRAGVISLDGWGGKFTHKILHEGMSTENH